MIVYCDAGPSWLIRTACKYSVIIFTMDIIFVIKRFSSVMTELYLSQPIPLSTGILVCFLDLSDQAYVTRCTGVFLFLFILASHDSNWLFTHKTVNCFACCACHWSQLSSSKTIWFWSSMWISSIGGISTYSEQIFIWHTTATVFTRWYSTGRCY